MGSLSYCISARSVLFWTDPFLTCQQHYSGLFYPITFSNFVYQQEHVECHGPEIVSNDTENQSNIHINFPISLLPNIQNIQLGRPVKINCLLGFNWHNHILHHFIGQIIVFSITRSFPYQFSWYGYVHNQKIIPDF